MGQTEKQWTVDFRIVTSPEMVAETMPAVGKEYVFYLENEEDESPRLVKAEVPTDENPLPIASAIRGKESDMRRRGNAAP